MREGGLNQRCCQATAVRLALREREGSSAAVWVYEGRPESSDYAGGRVAERDLIGRARVATRAATDHSSSVDEYFGIEIGGNARLQGV